GSASDYQAARKSLRDARAQCLETPGRQEPPARRTLHIVTLVHRPSATHQVLGTVRAVGKTRDAARNILLLRAAAAGADAVAECHLDPIASPNGTEFEASGVAVRCPTADGLQGMAGRSIRAEIASISRRIAV